MRRWDDGATPPQRQCRRSPLDGEIKISYPMTTMGKEWRIHPREEEEGPRWAMGGAQKGSDQIPISNSSSTAVRAPASGPRTPSIPRSQECRLSIRVGTWEAEDQGASTSRLFQNGIKTSYSNISLPWPWPFTSLLSSLGLGDAIRP